MTTTRIIFTLFALTIAGCEPQLELDEISEETDTEDVTLEGPVLLGDIPTAELGAGPCFEDDGSCTMAIVCAEACYDACVVDGVDCYALPGTGCGPGAEVWVCP